MPTDTLESVSEFNPRSRASGPTPSPSSSRPSPASGCPRGRARIHPHRRSALHAELFLRHRRAAATRFPAHRKGFRHRVGVRAPPTATSVTHFGTLKSSQGSSTRPRPSEVSEGQFLTLKEDHPYTLPGVCSTHLVQILAEGKAAEWSVSGKAVEAAAGSLWSLHHAKYLHLQRLPQPMPRTALHAEPIVPPCPAARPAPATPMLSSPTNNLAVTLHLKGDIKASTLGDDRDRLRRRARRAATSTPPPANLGQHLPPQQKYDEAEPRLAPFTVQARTIGEDDPTGSTGWRTLALPPDERLREARPRRAPRPPGTGLDAYKIARPGLPPDVTNLAASSPRGQGSRGRAADPRPPSPRPPHHGRGRPSSPFQATLGGNRSAVDLVSGRLAPQAPLGRGQTLELEVVAQRPAPSRPAPCSLEPPRRPRRAKRPGSADAQTRWAAGHHRSHGRERRRHPAGRARDA